MILSYAGHTPFLYLDSFKSQCCALTDMPKLFVTLFLFSVMRKTIGCSPLANTLLLKQITETLTLIDLEGVIFGLHYGLHQQLF